MGPKEESSLFPPSLDDRRLLLHLGLLVGAVAVRPVGRLLAVAEPQHPGLLGHKADGLERDLQVRVAVAAIAERLVVAESTRAPVVDASLPTLKAERLLVVDAALARLTVRRVVGALGPRL